MPHIRLCWGKFYSFFRKWLKSSYIFHAFLSTFVFVFITSVFAGTPQTIMECKSASGHASISGSPEGEIFDLKITIGKASIRYTDACDGSQCAPKENYGHLTVVDALYSRVFTIYFANTEGNNRGIFYALPNTVKYLKNERGYKAQYKAIYWGDDPRSNQPFKDFVSDPGIELACTQENKL